jgi:predicted DNA-binding transcriptional regulator AlpA
MLDTSGAGPPAHEALLIGDTASAALAAVSRATWHRLRAAGKLPPSVRLGRKVLWRRAEVVAWIEAGCPDGPTWEAMRAAAGRRTARILG